MTSPCHREAAAQFITKHYGDEEHPFSITDLASFRAQAEQEALERAAKVAESWGSSTDKNIDATGKIIASAIRALKDTP